MKRVYYNKLIRDKIPEAIRKRGSKYQTRAIEDRNEFEQELLKKVIEESGGLSRARTKEDFLDELADLLEIIDELLRVYKITPAQMRAARAKNRARKGGFKKRLFLHWSADERYRSNETPQGAVKRT